MGRAFSLGRIVATRGVLEAVTAVDIAIGLSRHSDCDWGDLSSEDKKHNDEAVKKGERLLSSYRTGADVKFWIITEWDRSVTTVLLPEEY